MANLRERRRPFVRTRSPTPPWLKDWKNHHSDREQPERLRNHEDYEPVRKEPVQERPAYKVYGPWTDASDDRLGWYDHDSRREKKIESGQWRDDHKPTVQMGVFKGYGPPAPAPVVKGAESVIDPVLKRGVENVVSQLVNLVSRNADAGGGSSSISQDLPFSQNEDDNEGEVTMSGDFSLDDESSGMQFVGISSKSLEQKKIRMERGLYCAICDMAVSCIDQYQSHLIGARHKKMLKRRGLDDELGTPSKARVNTGLVPVDTSIKMVQCIVCGEMCESNNLAPHVTLQKHLTMEKKWELLKKPIPRFIDMFVEKGSVPVLPMSNDVPYCKACNVIVSSYEELEQHNKGKKHLKMVKKEMEQEKSNLYCKVCDVHATCEKGMQDHYNGKKHAMQVLKLQEKETETQNDQQAPVFSCDVCNTVFCTDEELKEHFSKDEHFNNIRRKAMEIKAANPFSTYSIPQHPHPINKSTIYPPPPPQTAQTPAFSIPLPYSVRYPTVQPQYMQYYPPQQQQLYYPPVDNKKL